MYLLFLTHQIVDAMLLESGPALLPPRFRLVIYFATDVPIGARGLFTEV